MSTNFSLKDAWFLPKPFHFEQSLEDLKEYVCDHQEEHLAHAALGAYLFDSGDSEAAIVALEIAIKLAPNEPFYLYLLGRVHTNQGQWELAETAMNQAFSQTPEHVAYYGILANIYFCRGYQQINGSPSQHDYLKHGYQIAMQGLQINPEDHDCLLSVFNTLSTLSWIDDKSHNTEIAAILTRLLEHHPNSAQAHHSKALSLSSELDKSTSYSHRQQIINQALQSLQTALQLDPNQHSSRSNISRLLNQRYSHFYLLPEKLLRLLIFLSVFTLPLLVWTLYSYQKWGGLAWQTIVSGVALAPVLFTLLSFTYMQQQVRSDLIARQFKIGSYFNAAIILWSILFEIVVAGLMWETLPLWMKNILLLSWWWIVIPIHFLIGFALLRKFLRGKSHGF
jgi:tetratricopeptide (TPR) repeat protein